MDYINHEKPWVALKEMGMPQYLIVLCCGQQATVQTEYEETEWFPTGKGVTKGPFYLPINLYLEHIWKTGLDSEGVKMVEEILVT